MIRNVSNKSNIEKYTIAFQDVNGNPIKINYQYCRIIKIGGSNYEFLTVRASVTVGSEINDSGLKFIRLRSSVVIPVRTLFKDFILKDTYNKHVIITEKNDSNS